MLETGVLEFGASGQVVAVPELEDLGDDFVAGLGSCVPSGLRGGSGTLGSGFVGRRWCFTFCAVGWLARWREMRGGLVGKLHSRFRRPGIWSLF